MRRAYGGVSCREVFRFVLRTRVQEISEALGTLVEGRKLWVSFQYDIV